LQIFSRDTKRLAVFALGLTPQSPNPAHTAAGVAARERDGRMRRKVVTREVEIFMTAGLVSTPLDVFGVLMETNLLVWLGYMSVQMMNVLTMKGLTAVWASHKPEVKGGLLYIPSGSVLIINKLPLSRQNFGPVLEISITKPACAIDTEETSKPVQQLTLTDDVCNSAFVCLYSCVFLKKLQIVGSGKHGCPSVACEDSAS
jgi:hypothetical protein